MKLTYFSEQTLPRVKNGGRSATIARVALSPQGVIALNKEACRLMELKGGSKLTLGQDTDDPDNFYFFNDPQHGFVLREDKNMNCLFTHKAMVQLLAEARGLDPAKRIKAMIAGQPTILKGDKAATKYWGILVKPQI